MNIELIVLDVDGTMTDGSIIYGESGEEMKAFSVKDGLGIASWNRLGKKSAVITGRRSGIVQRRAEELKIDFIRQGVKNKKDELIEIADICKLSMSQIAVIGDDWNDYEMMRLAGVTFAPRDAADIISNIADFNLESKGGNGAVREMIDILIEAGGLSEEMRKLWSADSN